MIETKRLSILLLACLFLSGCARLIPADLPPTSTPTATTSPTAPPTQTIAPTSTSVPPTPTSSPSTPTSAPPTLSALPLATPYSDQPAAGICAEYPGETVVTVEIMPDIPAPRCLKVTPDQRLKVINRVNATLALKLGNLSASLQPNADYTFDQPFGNLLAPGVHVLEASPYFGPEIWLVEP